MFKVECPGCSAPYQVDERRVPSGGLKMRCPKCGSSFQVDPPPDPRTTGPSPVLGSPAAPLAGRPAPKATMVGVAPTALGAPKPPRPPPPRPVAKPVTAPAPLELDELDLPSSAGAKAAEWEVGLPAPAPARPGPPRPPPRAAAAAGSDDLELDLPGLRQPDAFDEVDLPVVGGGRKPAAPDAGFGVPDEIDLPAPVGFGADLPAPRARGGGGFGEIDLPAPAGFGARAPGGGGFGEIDLPSPSEGGFGELDLPMGAADLPSPRFDGFDLPSPTADLPSPTAGLPAVSAGLPATAGELPSLGAGLPQAAAGLPQAAAGLPQLGAGLPENAATLPQNAGALPELQGALPEWNPELPGASGSSSWGAEAPIPSEVVRHAGGGTGYGEVNLEPSAGGSIEAAERPRDEDMEFGAIPQEPPVHGQPPPALAPALPLPTDVRPRKRVGLRAAVGIGVLVVLGGMSLALVPDVGPFGVHWILEQVQRGDREKLLSETQQSARALLQKDTFPAAVEALGQIAAARGRSRRARSLDGYEVYVSYLKELRFGPDAEANARAKVLLDELGDVRDVPEIELARAAQAAQTKQFDDARSRLDSVAELDPADVAVLRGELELAAGDPARAEQAFRVAEEGEKSARSAFGLARAHAARGNGAEAEKLATQTLERSADHAGARLLLAESSWVSKRDEKRALAWLGEVVKEGSGASRTEQVRAHTWLGNIHLDRSRISHAEQAYAKALTLNPQAATALSGLGDALFRAGRYSEALARFEAGTQADAGSVAARVGVVKSLLALERLQDAEVAAKQLNAPASKEPQVSYWVGRVQEALGNRKEAAVAFRRSIELGGQSAHAVDAYIALALLQNQLGETEDAKNLLLQAKEKLPESAALYVALGELSLTQGRYAEAKTELERALELDPGDVGAKFRLGVALRRGREFDAAAKRFDEVAAIDKDYPGLALERGVLYEASGRTEQAIKSYESALASAPNDPDLMLRVGCGYAAGGQGAKAEELLRKVLQQRPTSAETHHCLGRALLMRGTNLAEALKMLERSTDLDPNRAEYHLYVGWAAIEASRHSRAEAALKRALELDQGLADAYWQRGILRQREGRVKDAVRDLKRALELRPTRYEAHASLADTYYDLGQEAEAMAEWDRAIAALPDNPTWRFRYGRLLVNNRRAGEGRAQLSKAIELGEKRDPRPAWFWEAHLFLARAMGGGRESIPHWEAFLTLGPRDSPYRSEAKKALAGLGKPWEGG